MHILFQLNIQLSSATLSLLFFQNFMRFNSYLLYMILLSRGNSKILSSP